MKFSALLVVTALSCCLLGQVPLTSTPVSNPEDQRLIDRSKAVTDALVHKDAARLKNMLADDFRAVWSEGHLYPRDEVIGAAQEGMFQQYTPYNMRVLHVTKDSAIVTYDAIIQAPEGDTDLAPRYQHISDLWTLQGDDWKLKFQQSTPLRSID